MHCFPSDPCSDWGNLCRKLPQRALDSCQEDCIPSRSWVGVNSVLVRTLVLIIPLALSQYKTSKITALLVPFAVRGFSKIFFTFSEDDFRKKLLQVTVRNIYFHSSLHSLESFQNCCSIGSILKIFPVVAKEVFNEVSFSELYIQAQTGSEPYSGSTSTQLEVSYTRAQLQLNWKWATLGLNFNSTGSEPHLSSTSTLLEVSYTLAQLQLKL